MIVAWTVEPGLSVFGFLCMFAVWYKINRHEDSSTYKRRTRGWPLRSLRMLYNIWHHWRKGSRSQQDGISGRMRMQELNRSGSPSDGSGCHAGRKHGPGSEECSWGSAHREDRGLWRLRMHRCPCDQHPRSRNLQDHQPFLRRRYLATPLEGYSVKVTIFAGSLICLDPKTSLSESLCLNMLIILNIYNL